MLSLMNEILILAGCPIIKESKKKSYPIDQNDIIGAIDKFDPCLTEFNDDPYKAIFTLLKQKEGYVPHFIYKNGIGWIGLAYGWTLKSNSNVGYGIAHIVAKHGLKDLYRIPKWIDEGVINNSTINSGRITIEHPEAKIAIATKWHGADKVLIISGYKLT